MSKYLRFRPLRLIQFKVRRIIIRVKIVIIVDPAQKLITKTGVTIIISNKSDRM